MARERLAADVTTAEVSEVKSRRPQNYDGFLIH